VKAEKKKKELITIDLSSRLTPIYRLSTGVIAFDMVLQGGIPSGRMTEMYGGESSYKSLVVLKILSNALLDDKNFVVYVDTEGSIEKGLVDMVNLDIEKLIYLDINKIYTLEALFDQLEFALDKALELKKRLIFAIDSIAAVPGYEDMVNELGVRTAAARRAMIIKGGLTKYMPRIRKEDGCLILVNQLYDKMGVVYGDTEDTPGGKAIRFWASVRMRFKNKGMIKDEKSGEQIGNKCNLLIKKNKAGKPFGQVNFEHIEMHDLDKYTGLLDYFVRHGEVIQSGAWYYFPDDEKHKFRGNQFPELWEARQ